MPPNSQKCLREDLRQDILVKGVYQVDPIDGLQVDYTVSALLFTVRKHLCRFHWLTNLNIGSYKLVLCSQVKDSKNHILSQKEDITSGKFTFSVETYDMFEICFISKVLNKSK